VFGVLGPTRVTGADGAEVALGGPRRRAVLALLALEAGHVVTVERLVDGVYGDEAPASALNAVQSQVSRLRQVCPAPIEGHPAGYRLAVEPEAVDAHRFERLAAEGRSALHAGEPDVAARTLGDALALWRGPALADVREAPFAKAQAVRLEELRLGVVEDRVEADLALGRHHALVAELSGLVAVHPLRERLRAQLMRALSADGRQGEALEVYEAARWELAEALGVDPGPDLVAAHLAVLRGEADSAAVPAPAGPGAPAAVAPSAGGVPRGTEPSPWGGCVPRGTRPRHQLPAQLTSFVGRDEEMELVARRLADHRLVTLIGPGGAGKTRLAVEAAGQFPDDAVFVELAGLADGAEVPQAVLGALGLREAALRATPGTAGSVAGAAATEPVARIAAALDDRRLLVVLDNCEHVVAEAAAFAERLLAAAPGVRVLATSREGLGITGEALCPVPTLALPHPDADRERALASPAVRLFVERAAAVLPGFDPVADPATTAAVVGLCAALDGLPLAIELAAARLRALSVTEIAERLGALPDPGADSPYSLGVRPDALFRLLSRGSRTAQRRQQTLRAVVDWSWELLPEDERAVLRRASVFAGGWTLEAAEAICSDRAARQGATHVASTGADTESGITAEDVLDLITALVEKSLVVAPRPDPDGRVRYRMLESIRAYGAERLDEAEETERIRHAHARWFLDLALRADPHLRRAEQVEWLRLLSEERDNLQAALHRCLDAGDRETAMRLVAALSSYWLLRGLRYEGAAAAGRILADLGPNPPAGLEEEYALCVLAAIGPLADTDGFDAHVAAATRVVEGVNRISRRYPALTLLWAPFAGVPEGGPDTLDVIEAALAGDDDPWYRALGHLGSGFQRWIVAGDAEPARRHGLLALEGFRREGDRWGMITSLNVLADLADCRGDVRTADALLGEALVLARELDSALDMADLLCNQAAYRRQQGDLDSAAAACEEAVELARRSGAPESLAMAHFGLAETARLRGDRDSARALCEQALAECPSGWFSSAGTTVVVLVALGRLAVADGDPAAARDCFRQALDRRAGVLFPMTAATAAEAVAGLALLEGQPERAATLLGAASALRGGPLPGPDARTVATAARAALGDAPFGAAVDAGAALARDEAAALVAAYTHASV
jgi:predicted ATPase/DNA-binding SARP family transcriptional activator